MEQNQATTLEFNQDWHKEEPAQNDQVVYSRWERVKEYALIFLGWLWTALVFLVTTPIFLIMWCINFVKTLLGMFVFWVVGKIAVFLVFSGVIALLAHLQWISGETCSNLMDWYSSHILGTPMPEGAVGSPMFPHINIEIWLILSLSLILATVATIPHHSDRY
ncbi:hypothetical protein P7J41_05485 [Streptococcus suis]|uniref:hypothetical protein n=1 Tax=Streptococcus suis TaxID=1307 RepID=UPI0038B7ABCB